MRHVRCRHAHTLLRQPRDERADALSRAARREKITTHAHDSNRRALRGKEEEVAT
jgi:hypothetical protein